MTEITYPIASTFLFTILGLLTFSFALIIFWIAIRLISYPIQMFWSAIRNLIDNT